MKKRITRTHIDTKTSEEDVSGICNTLNDYKFIDRKHLTENDLSKIMKLGKYFTAIGEKSKDDFLICQEGDYVLVDNMDGTFSSTRISKDDIQKINAKTTKTGIKSKQYAVRDPKTGRFIKRYDTRASLTSKEIKNIDDEALCTKKLVKTAIEYYSEDGNYEKLIRMIYNKLLNLPLYAIRGHALDIYTKWQINKIKTQDQYLKDIFGKISRLLETWKEIKPNSFSQFV